MLILSTATATAKMILRDSARTNETCIGRVR
jgi:hypothetical protein